MKKLTPALKPLEVPLDAPGITQIVSQGMHRPLHEYQQIPIEWIESDPEQPRKAFDEDSLQALSDDIQQHGIDSPLVVRSAGINRYRLIAGERRFRAAKRAGIQTVPIFIRDDLSPDEVKLLQLRENIQRENLSPIEEAQGLRDYKSITGKTWKEVAGDFGWKEITALTKVKLLDAPPSIQEMIASRSLTPGHYQKLASLDEERQIELAQQASREQLSVKGLEERIRPKDAFPPQKTIVNYSSSPPSNEGDPPPAVKEEAAIDDNSSRTFNVDTGSAKESSVPIAEPREYGTIKVTATLPPDIHRSVTEVMEEMKIKNYADYVKLCIERDLRERGKHPGGQSAR
ncbi:MAG: ParB/RepB/Spo0J family partition protein [Armatimonadetes bacterium]|nr:ParB/RepB/Spo0J family partition protein [Armatimonadota bacterium]